jgi:hypothetical protein
MCREEFMTSQPEGDKRANETSSKGGDQANRAEQPSSRALDFLAQQLHKNGEQGSTKQHDALISDCFSRLSRGDYDGTHLVIEESARELLKRPSIPPETTTLLKSALRLLADEHLQHNSPTGTLRTLDVLLELARKETGTVRGEITTLSFERVLTLKIIRERQGAGNHELNESYLEAIKDTRKMALQESSGITNTVRGHILSHLGKCLFYVGAWEEAASTLLRSLELVTNPAAKASAFKMLAQISHYQGEREEAHGYIRALDLIPGWNDPEHGTLAEQIERGAAPAGAAKVPPTLQCINDTLTRGFSLLEQELYLAAQGTLEGALTMIEHQYGRRHYLATTALTLLCKTLADRASLSNDQSEQGKLFTEAREHAMRGFDILQSENADRPRQKQLLEFSRDISEALDDHHEVTRLSKMIDADLF